MPRHIASWGLVLLLAFGAPSGPVHAESQAVPKLPSTKGWVEVRTPHFVLDSRAGTSRTRKLAVRLEQFRVVLSRLTKGLVLDTPVPTQIVVFPNDEELTPYKINKLGIPNNVSGYFLSGPFRAFLVLDASAGDSPMRVVYHEYFHAVTSASFEDVPLWVSEGLAEYFSTFRTVLQGSSVQIGHPIPEHVRLLQVRGPIPWEEVFATTVRSDAYNESSRQGAFYAQSWLAVYYLTTIDEHFKTLSKFLTLLRAGIDPNEAIETATGLKPKAFGARVTEYARHGRTNVVSWDFGEELDKVQVSERPLEAPEIYLFLGEVQAYRGSREEAARLLEAARSAGAPVAAVEAALGRAAFLNKDKAEAESHYRKALDAGAKGAEPFVSLGELLAERASSSQQPDFADARVLFRNALEQDAASFPALVDLARTYLLESDTRPGLEAIDAARKLRPFNDDAILTDACLRARGGRPDAASQLVARELSRRDPEIARWARSCVTTGTMAAARDRIQAKDVEGAKAIAALAIAAIDDPAARSEFERMQSALAKGVAIAFKDETADASKASAHAAVAAFNGAIGLQNAGRLDEALAEFDAIATACATPDACARAKQAASDLRPVVAHNHLVTRFNFGVELARREKYKDATAVFRALEKEVDDPKFLADVQKMLRRLGEKPAR